MKKTFFIFLFAAVLTIFPCLKTSAENNNGIEISNNYFSFSIPDEMKGTYTVLKQNNGIFIYEKKSESDGFAFGIKIFKSPKEYANLNGHRKIGELKDRKNNLYDLVLIRPTEISYGEGEKILEDYTRLYDFGEIVEIKGINGSKYVKNQGMKGKDLYNEILKKYKSAITEKWEVDKYNSEDLGLMYYVLSNSKKKLTDKIGYAYYDINHDGIDELLIGEIKRFPLKGYIYDIYTMVDRNPVHALSADTQERYFICNNYFICIEYLSNNKENCTAVYFLEKNSTNISPQIKFIHDPAKNKKTPGFIVYGNSKNPENVTKRIFKEKKDSFCKYNKINLTPLSKFKY